MSVVALLYRGQGLRKSLRRGFTRHGFPARFARCTTTDELERLFRREVVDAVVADPRLLPPGAAALLVARYPAVPFFAAHGFGPHDGALLQALKTQGIRGFLVDGVDGAAAGEWLALRTAARRRRSAVKDAVRLLRLSEDLQQRVWEAILAGVGTRVTTTDLAAECGYTREHLSRECAAGGAPNLKRLIELARVCCAADLLANPGYDVRSTARALRYASPSHLGVASRRIAGVTPRELPRLGPRQVFLRFLKLGTRSRL